MLILRPLVDNWSSISGVYFNVGESEVAVFRAKH